MLSNHLLLCHSLLLLPSVFPSIKVFANELACCIRWPKYWNVHFSITLSNEYWGLISFRIDWFDLLADQQTLESSPTPQFKSISSSVLRLVYGPTLTSIHDYWKNHRMTLIPWWGLTLMTSSNPHCLPKMSSTNAIVVGTRALMYEFWGSMNIQFIAFYPPKFMTFSHTKHIHSISTSPKVILASPLKSKVQNLI